jgi:hypothetical protein
LITLTGGCLLVLVLWFNSSNQYGVGKLSIFFFLKATERNIKIVSTYINIKRMCKGNKTKPYNNTPTCQSQHLTPLTTLSHGCFQPPNEHTASKLSIDRLGTFSCCLHQTKARCMYVLIIVFKVIRRSKASDPLFTF